MGTFGTPWIFNLQNNIFMEDSIDTLHYLCRQFFCLDWVIYCLENHFFCCCLFSKAVLHNNVTRRKKSVAAAAVATCFCCCDTMHALFSVVVILLAKRPFSIITKIDLNFCWLLQGKITNNAKFLWFFETKVCCPWCCNLCL